MDESVRQQRMGRIPDGIFAKPDLCLTQAWHALAERSSGRRLDMFNSLKYTKVLEEVGIPRDQAEAHIQIMTEVMESDLATKNDIKDLRTEMREMKSELKSDLIQLEYRMTIKVGTLLIVGFTTMISLMKYWIPH